MTEAGYKDGIGSSDVVLDPTMRRIFSVDVCRGRHRPAHAVAMQGGCYCVNPHLQMGDVGQAGITLFPLQMGLSERAGARASKATRMKRLSNKSVFDECETVSCNVAYYM